MPRDVDTLQAGKEGYLIKVTPENYLELLEITRMRELDGKYVNYDPNWKPTLIVIRESARKSVFTETILITAEELKLLLFIHSLEK